MSTPIRFIVQFTLIMLVQIFLLNDVMIKSSVSVLHIPVFIPIIYPLVLLLLPVNIHHGLLMFIGFITGLTMDMFSNTPGVHASACLLIAYMRPFVLNLFLQQQLKELGATVPSLFKLGFNSFMLYCMIMIFTHHFYFYLLQFWSFKSILIILYKTILSGVLSVMLILLSQLLFAKKEIKRS
jgi:hypothetical protein